MIAIHENTHIIVTLSLQANLLPITVQSITSNNIKTKGYLNLRNIIEQIYKYELL